MRWIDQGSYDPESSLEICQGLLGHVLEKTGEGRYHQMQLPEGVTLDTAIHDYSPGNDGTFAVMQPIIDKLDLNANLTGVRNWMLSMLRTMYRPTRCIPMCSSLGTRLKKSACCRQMLILRSPEVCRLDRGRRRGGRVGFVPEEASGYECGTLYPDL